MRFKSCLFNWGLLGFLLDPQQGAKSASEVLVREIVQERIYHRTKVTKPEQDVLKRLILNELFCTYEVLLPTEGQSKEEEYPAEDKNANDSS